MGGHGTRGRGLGAHGRDSDAHRRCFVAYVCGLCVHGRGLRAVGRILGAPALGFGAHGCGLGVRHLRTWSQQYADELEITCVHDIP